MIILYTYTKYQLNNRNPPTSAITTTNAVSRMTEARAQFTLLELVSSFPAKAHQKIITTFTTRIITLYPIYLLL